MSPELDEIAICRTRVVLLAGAQTSSNTRHLKNRKKRLELEDVIAAYIHMVQPKDAVS